MKKKLLAMLLTLSMVTSLVISGGHTIAATLDGNTKIEQITVGEIQTGNESVTQFELHTVTYDGKDKVKIGGEEKNGVVLPLYMPTQGDLYLDFTEEQIVSGEGTFAIFSDEECTTRVGETVKYDNAKDVIKLQKRFTVSKGNKKYYLAFYREKDGEDEKEKAEEEIIKESQSFTFRTYCVTSANKTLSSGKWLAIAYNSEDTSRYYKMRIEQAGNVVLQSDKSMSITVCGVDKKDFFSEIRLRKENDYKVSAYFDEGIYYIKTCGSYVKTDKKEKWAKLRFTSYSDDASLFTITPGKKSYIRPYSSESICYYKYVPTVTGYMILGISKPEHCFITLCNEKKEPIADEKGNETVYGVRKGVTYYLMVSTTKEQLKDKVYKISLTCKQGAVKEKCGSKKSKAVSIKKGYTAPGVLAAGKKESDWYKFTLKDPTPVKITIKAAGVGTILVRIIDPNGVDLTGGGSALSEPTCAKLLESVGNWSKGTYYIQVLRKDDKSSGYYNVKWE